MAICIKYYYSIQDDWYFIKLTMSVGDNRYIVQVNFLILFLSFPNMFLKTIL